MKPQDRRTHPVMYKRGRSISAAFLRGRPGSWKYPYEVVMAWLCLLFMSTLVLLLYSVGTPIYMLGLSKPCSTCIDEHLTPMMFQALHTLGISLTVYMAYWTGINLAFVLGYCAVAGLIVWRKPADRLALFASCSLIALGASFPDIPGALAAAYPLWHVPLTFLNMLGFPCFIAFLFLFPTGRFVPRWTRWGAVGFAACYEFTVFAPASILHATSWIRSLTLCVVCALFGMLIYAQIYRYRFVSTPQERQQTKWVIFGASIALIGFLLLAFLPLAVLQAFFPAQHLSLFFSVFFITGVYVALLLIPVALAVAILRYRLWDIDSLIGRTLVYGLLTTCIVAIYIGVVVLCGALLRSEGNLLISLFATGLVAVLVQPLRALLQRGVNRLLYGQRDEPYVVIARLSQRLKGTLAPEVTLSTIVETVAQALKLPYAAILWQQEEKLEIAASYGQPAGEPFVLPLTYQAELIGQLQLAPRSPGEAFTSADVRLLEELARQAGLAAHAIRLADDLQKARERLVLAREEERRRLRRDLHDGVGPTLASLSQRIDLARHLVVHDPEAAVAQLSQLKLQVKATIGDIRRVAYALRPPILDELGLVSAIHEYILHLQEANGLAVSLEAPAEMPTLPAAVEVAAYRVLLEALTNVVRHASAQHCLVRLELADAQILHLSVTDDGCGLPDRYRVGVGISSFRERVAELGGTCVIGTEITGGTRVFVRLPLKPER